MKFVPRAPIDNRRGEQYTRSKTQNAPPAARRALIKGGIRHDPKTVCFAAALRGTALCLLAGCDTAASGSTGSASAPANSSASASSENIPSTTNEANTSGLRPNFDENSLFSITGTSDAFEPCLGWGPGVSGCSLKSVLAAASLLQWAEQTNLTSRTTDAIEDAFSQWYDALDSMDQESFAEAWPLIKDDANALLTDKDSLSGRIEDAGLDPADLPGCSEKNWDALQDVIDRLTPEATGEF